MTALDNASAKKLPSVTGERNDDHARSEVFSVPSKSDSEQGTAHGDTPSLIGYGI